VIRAFQTTDTEQVITLCKQWLEETENNQQLDIEQVLEAFKDIAIDDTRYSMVLTHQGKVVGFCVCRVTENVWNKNTEGLIEWMYVKPNHRTMAIGLVDACEQWFKQQDCKYFTFSISAFDKNLQSNIDYLNDVDQMFEGRLKDVGAVYLGAVK
jgi:GNAT superfamily N-acetyltransferase